MKRSAVAKVGEYIDEVPSKSTNDKYLFSDEMALRLSPVGHSINKYFPDLENRQVNAWVTNLGQSREKGIFPNTDIETKAQFLGLCKDKTMKLDFENTIGGYSPIIKEKILVNTDPIHRNKSKELIESLA